ncbi:hypothetical protein ACJZ2D_016770 [Fusarium nematophilum]
MAHSHLEKLPAELIIQIFKELSSPLDIHAFVSASPNALRNYTSHRHRILRPAIRQLETWLQTESMLLDAMLACRLRLLPHDISHLDPLQTVSEVRSVLESRLTHPEICQSSLFILCELFRLQKEANEVTTTYASQAWDVIESEAAAHHKLRGLFKPPLPRVPLVLSKTELRRFQEGYLQFEINRHCLHYDKTLLLATNLSQKMQHSIHVFFLGPVPARAYADLNWEMRAFQSIFRFLFDQYRLLVLQVHIRIDIQRARQLSLKVSPGELEEDSSTIQNLIKAKEESPDIILNRMRVFYQRKAHQELRYVAYLCSHGFSLLDRLKRMDVNNRDHFILTTFQWMCSRELAAGIAERRKMDNLGFSLEKLCDIARDWPRHDPWMSGRYFWDGCRLNELRHRRHML